MKKVFAVLALAGILALLPGCGSKPASTPNADDGITGTFTGTGEGMGEITATVTLENGVIVDVQFDAPNESTGIADPALEQLPPLFVAQQTYSVDTVAGATITSQGMIKAVRAALQEAGFEAE